MCDEAGLREIKISVKTQKASLRLKALRNFPRMDGLISMLVESKKISCIDKFLLTLTILDYHIKLQKDPLYKFNVLNHDLKRKSLTGHIFLFTQIQHRWCLNTYQKVGVTQLKKYISLLDISIMTFNSYMNLDLMTNIINMGHLFILL